MASQGPLSVSVAADDASVGTKEWQSTVGNPLDSACLSSSDDTRASAFGINSSEITHYLTGKNPGFTIPAGAAIDGIVIEIEKGLGGSTSRVVRDHQVRIIKSGTIGATDKASGMDWPANDAYTSYGSPSDLWGETWIASDLNASDFGIAFSCQRISGAGVTPAVDHIRITAYYTEPSFSVSMIL